MQIVTQEHGDVMAQFEREFKGRRLDRELKAFWVKGLVYQDGEVNELFLAYRRGYALAKSVYQATDVLSGDAGTAASSHQSAGVPSGGVRAI
jgi:hypothetical protein